MSGSEREGHHGLRWWHRFHIRLALLNGAVVFVVVTAMAFVFYELSYGAELSGLQGRLRATVATISRHIDPREIAALPAQGAPDDPVVSELFSRFKAITEGDRDISSIYLLCKTDEPGQLRFVVDYASDGDSARPGQAYDASELKRLLEGLDRISVESKLWRDQWGLSISGYAPVKLDGRPFGIVGVDVGAARVEEMSERVLVTTLGFYGIALLLLGALAVVVSRQIRGPLSEINAAAQRIADGDFGSRINSKRKDEFGLVGAHFDTIAESLQERDFIRDVFGKYVARDVARRILSDRSLTALGGEEREATILFADLAGFSTMNEQVPPREMIEMLNTYLSAMNTIIDGSGGVVIEFLGDAILCVFNTPNDVRMHADTAVRCALSMRRRLAELNAEWADTEVARRWRETGYDELCFRIGVHSGTVVAGNIGSPTRMKYGVLGDVVNVAARLEHMNKRLSTTILISQATYDRLEEDLHARATPCGAQDVRGRVGKVEVYSL